MEREREQKKDFTPLVMKLTRLISEEFPSYNERKKIDMFHPVQNWLVEYGRGQFVGSAEDLIQRIIEHFEQIGFERKQLEQIKTILIEELSDKPLDLRDEFGRA